MIEKVNVFNNGEVSPFAVFSYIDSIDEVDGKLELKRIDLSKTITITISNYAYYSIEEII